MPQRPRVQVEEEQEMRQEKGPTAPLEREVAPGAGVTVTSPPRASKGLALRKDRKEW